MDTDKYRAFLKVLECNNFSRAAIELGYTQSVISHCIVSLENQFGFKLLIRDRGKIGLTTAGKTMLQHIRDIVNAQERLEQRVSSFLGL